MVRAQIAFLVVALAGVAEAQEEPAYPLDSLERTTSTKGRLKCPNLPKVKYRGRHLRYHKPTLVYSEFLGRLERFEKIVAETATEFYGRAPRRLKHIGTYNCRRIRKFPDLLSEHALANAIDVEGFDFGPAPKGARGSLPHKRLRRSFRVRVADHWKRDKGVAAIHSRFLRTLVDRLQEQKLFRVMLGPAWPGHHDHFHFDMAPYELVEL
jgi:hypothetical protein